MSAFAGKDLHLVMQSQDLIREAIINLMASDKDFIESITRNTNSKGFMKYRCDTISRLVDEILYSKSRQPRCFTLEMKQRLFDKNKSCKICDNHICSIDDAAVDHIEQYWRGGKTIEENARLTHRYCNNARSKYD